MTPTERGLVPGFILDQFGRGSTSGQFEAGVLFVDTVAFSDLTGHLTRDTVHGAETLADLMGQIYDPMIARIEARGGFVTMIAGDGLTAAFPAPLIEGCAQAALDIQQILTTVDIRHEDWQMQVRIGVAVGPLAWRIYASPDGVQADYVFQGAAMDGAVYAQSQAPPQGIFATARTAAFLSLDIDAEDGPAGSGLLVLRRAPLPEAAVDGNAPVQRPSSPAPFRPAYLARREIDGEFRHSFSLFVQFHDVVSPDDLAPAMAAIFPVLQDWGVADARLDWSDKGPILFCHWGALGAHEKDLDRTLRFALATRSACPARLSVGVAVGTTYAGFIGSRLYSEFSCLGPSTNLAVRLARRAKPGEILVSEAVAEGTDRRYAFDAGRSLELKGIGTTRAFALEGIRHQGREITDEPNVERGGEVRAIQQHLGVFDEVGHVPTLVVSGEAGMGKSHLLRTLRKWNTSKAGPLWITCGCDPLERRSLLPFRDLLLPFASDAATLRSMIEGGARERDQAWIDLLLGGVANLLEIEAGDTGFEDLDSNVRLNVTLDGLTAALRGLCRERPMIAAIEDLHWIDPESHQLLARISRLSADRQDGFPLALIVTTRGDDIGIEGAVVGETCRLGAMGREQVANLLEAELGAPATDHAVELIESHTEGNPLFVQQVAEYLVDEGLIHFQHQRWRLHEKVYEIPLPKDARSLLVAQIDRTAEDGRLVLAISAVLGVQFTPGVIAAVAAELEQREVDLKDLAAGLVGQRLWIGLGPSLYGFRHTLIREAAYEMQVFAQRRRIHAAAATVLAGMGTTSAAELARHHDAAGQVDQAVAQYRMAQEEAEARFQNVSAARFLERILALRAPVDSEGCVEDGIRLSRLYRMTGTRDLVPDLMEKLDHWSKDSAPKTWLRVATERLSHDYVTGAYFAMDTYAPAYLPLVENEVAGTLEATEFYWFLALNRLFRQDPENVAVAEEMASSALRHAKISGDADALYRGYTACATVNRYQNDPVALANYEKAQDYCVSEASRGETLSRIGSILMRAGEFERARDNYQQALDIALRQNGMPQITNCQLSLLYLATRELDIDLSRHFHGELTRNAREHDYPRKYVEANTSLASVLVAGGCIKEAERLVRDSYEVSKARGLKLDQHEYFLAELQAELGDLEAAIPIAQAALERREPKGWPFDLCEVRLLLGQCHLAAGRIANARDVLHPAESLLASHPFPLSTYARRADAAHQLRSALHCLMAQVELAEGHEAAAMERLAKALDHFEHFFEECQSHGGQDEQSLSKLCYLLLGALDAADMDGPRDEVLRRWRTWALGGGLKPDVRGAGLAGACAESVYRNGLFTRSLALEALAPVTSK